MLKVVIAALILLSIDSNAQPQQKINTVRVVDKDTKRVIPYVAVSISKAKLAISTQNDGLFNIPGNLALMKDTITISAQTYNPIIIPLNKLNGKDSVFLIKKMVTRNISNLTYHSKETLNYYNPQEVGLFIGVPTHNSEFDYRQIAQKFVSVKNGSRLNSISISKKVEFLSTTFRIRIYDEDKRTGGPGIDLCDEIIEVSNLEYLKARSKSSENQLLGNAIREKYHREDALTKIDLVKYNIIIPNQTFFVAVEWLRDSYNQGKGIVYNEKTGNIDSFKVYRPFIGVSPVTRKNVNIWVMELDGKWKTYDHFYPLGTDLAIKATVEY